MTPSPRLLLPAAALALATACERDHDGRLFREEQPWDTSWGDTARPECWEERQEVLADEPVLRGFSARDLVDSFGQDDFVPMFWDATSDTNVHVRAELIADVVVWWARCDGEWYEAEIAVRITTEDGRLDEAFPVFAAFDPVGMGFDAVFDADQLGGWYTVEVPDGLEEPADVQINGTLFPGSSNGFVTVFAVDPFNGEGIQLDGANW